MSSAADLSAGDGSLRQRTGVASQPVLSAEQSASNHPLEKEPPRYDANNDVQQPGEHDKPNKTYGRTPDGTGMPCYAIQCRPVSSWVLRMISG